MQIVDYYKQEYQKAVALRDSLLKFGYNAPVVFKLNSILNKFDILLKEYVILKDTIDNIAVSKQEFGSNRNLLSQKISDIEQLSKNINTLIDGINVIEIDQLTANSVGNNFVDANKQVCINRSQNAFPECVPVEKISIPNNLYLIEDKEIEEYNVLLTNFLELVEDTYSKMQSSQNLKNYAEVLSKLYSIQKYTADTLNLVNDVIKERDYYNSTCKEVYDCDDKYYEYQKYPDKYNEMLSVICDIYQINCEEFDKIVNNI